MNDYQKRDLGAKSIAALDALEAAIWQRSCATMAEAEAAYVAGTLAPEESHRLLIALLEQRRLRSQLEGQIEEGVRATKRVVERENRAQAEQEHAERIVRIGGNRFVGQPGMPSRSRVGPSKDVS